MDGEHHLFDRGFELHGDNALGNKFRSLGTDDVNAENFAILGIRNDFHKAIVRVEDGGFRVADKRELTDLDLVTLLFGLRFGQANAEPICGSQ